MTDINCSIWHTPARRYPTTRDASDVVSPRAGGRYMLTRSAEVNMRGFDDRTKARLSTWIVDQHRAGVEIPLITTDVLNAIEHRSPLRLSERLDRFFAYLSRRRVTFGEEFLARIGLDGDEESSEVMAWMECVDPAELGGAVELLKQDGLLMPYVLGYMLTPDGLRRLDEVERNSRTSGQAFVAMWFDASLNDVYEQGIAPAIREAGYHPLRIDQKEHANKIDDEIVAEIRRSAFVIADFTSEIADVGEKRTAVARGGVYYEAGFAQGLGLPVIWCARADCIDHVHFDTRQFAHIVWDGPADLRKKLRDRIVAVLGEGPKL